MTTLDTDFLQCLVGYPEDPNFYWHHRVLLVGGKDGVWIWLTPTGEVQRGKLGPDDAVVPLRRNAAFPDGVNGANIFSFDPITADELQGYYSEAVGFAKIIGLEVGAVPVSKAEQDWYISDITSSAYGERVSREVYANDQICRRHGDVGVLELDGCWVSIVRVGKGCARDVAIADWDAFVSRGQSGKSRDPRLLGDQRDSDGVRHCPLRVALELSVQKDLLGFPVQGKRASKEFLLAVRDAGQSTLEDHSANFIRLSGLPEKSAPAREHKLISKVLRLLYQYDQLDLVNLAGGEMLIRRLLQLETATRKNPRAPNFDGLDIILDHAMDESGCAVVPEFSKWVAEQQKSDFKVLEGSRRWHEEQEALKKKAKGPGGKGGDGS